MATTATTNAAGVYEIPYLNSGTYDVTVSAPGFQQAVRKGLDVQVGERIAIDFQLHVSGMQTSVTVSAEATPVLESASATSGTIVDHRRITELPLVDGNPFMLINTSAGVSVTNEVMNSQRPFDNTGPSGARTDGAPGGNTFTLDGAPNTGNTWNGGAQVAYVPPADAVEEFKVETSAFDAQHGYTAGANVNVSIRSGTNKLHGTAYEFYRPPELVAREFFAKSRGAAPNSFTYHRFGGSIGGPVWLPKVYDGRDKTFFFASYENMLTDTPGGATYTIPTDAERTGSFAGLPAIYDPLTATKSGGRITREAFPNNAIPASRLNPIAMNYLKYYPKANMPGLATGENNYFSNNSTGDNYNSELFRVDHAFSEKNRAFVRIYRNLREQKGIGFAGEVNGIYPSGNRLLRGNQGIGAEDVYVLSPSLILNVKAGFTRWYQGNDQTAPGFDLSLLGFPASTLALFRRGGCLPQFAVTGFQNLGSVQGDFTAANNLYAAPTLSMIRGRHSLRMGFDFRDYLYNGIPKEASAGLYTFDTTYTRGPLDNSPAQFGQGLASLLLGIPAGGRIDRNADYATAEHYHALFVQDDFKLNARLTLNLGLRYDWELPTTERFNRAVRGFDPTAVLPIDGAVRTAYAAAPDVPGLPVSALKVAGGLNFANSDNRYIWKTDKKNFQPRAGLAWQVTPKTVVRGGFGLYMSPWVGGGVRQTGFSQSTPIVASLNGGLSFVGSLANPFPLGVADPAGAAAGVSTFVGQDISFTPLDRINSLTERWETSVQRELPGQWKLEVSYSGSHGYDLPISTNLNAIPAKYQSTTSTRNQAVIDYLSFQVANPYRGLAPSTTGLGSSSTIPRSTLLKPFSQFGNVSSARYDGSSLYHSLQVRGEHRFRRGFTLFMAYTKSRLWEDVSLLNDSDTRPEHSISQDNRNDRFVANGILELPVGRGRHFGNKWGRGLDVPFGGWQVSSVFMTQSGRPIALGNVYFTGDPGTLQTTYDRKKLSTPIFDTSGFYFWDEAVMKNKVIDPTLQRNDSRIRLANNIRTLPSMIANFRGPAIVNLDVSAIKTVSISERWKVQLRAESLNALNYIQFAEPGLDPTSAAFGLVTKSRNPTRQWQFCAKVVF